MPIQIGDVCPDFQLKNQHGQMIKISDFIGKKYLVIYFYPKDFTSGCTAEACYFRDNFEIFKEYDCEIFGISHDGIRSHRAFSKKHHLNFSLLSDPLGKVRRLFGVPRSFFGLIPGRVTYLIDKKGIVQGIYDSRINPWNHIQKALDKLELLKAQELKNKKND